MFKLNFISEENSNIYYAQNGAFAVKELPEMKEEDGFEVYIDGDEYHFMDPETFEDIQLDASIIADNKDFLVENQSYSILHVDDRPISIELPASIEMRVKESAEGVKGDTASNVQKPATLETGLTIQVPLFIKEGELVRVSTSERTYMGRA